MRHGRMRVPIDARHLFSIELHFLEKRSAQSVKHAVLDGSPQSFGIDDKSAVLRAHQPFHPNVAGFTIDLDLRDLSDDRLTTIRIGNAAARQDLSGANRFW